MLFSLAAHPAPSPVPLVGATGKVLHPNSSSDLVRTSSFSLGASYYNLAPVAAAPAILLLANHRDGDGGEGR